MEVQPFFIKLACILNTQVFRTILPTIIVDDEGNFCRCENFLNLHVNAVIFFCSNELVDCSSLSQTQAASEYPCIEVPFFSRVFLFPVQS